MKNCKMLKSNHAKSYSLKNLIQRYHLVDIKNRDSLTKSYSENVENSVVYIGHLYWNKIHVV